MNKEIQFVTSVIEIMEHSTNIKGKICVSTVGEKENE
jgi:hypothetical protein